MRDQSLTRTDGNPIALLQGNSDARGIPSFAIGEDEAVELCASVPIAEGFPLEWARKQVMVCMGLIAENTRELIQAWSKDSNTEGSAETVDWDTAKKIASVAGALIRGFATG